MTGLMNWALIINFHGNEKKEGKSKVDLVPGWHGWHIKWEMIGAFLSWLNIKQKDEFNAILNYMEFFSIMYSENYRTRQRCF